MACLSCARGFIGECSCDSGSQVERPSSPAKTLMEGLSSYQPDSGGEKREPGRPQKEDNFLDPKSTGRKRAATLYPLNRESFCEWRDLANCGGGKYPIIGCSTGYQENLHHGPDKDTLNNTRLEDSLEGRNVHKICSNCHNRWHAANDKDYDPTIPHEPREADFSERLTRLTQELSPAHKKK